jgi:TldD protein
MSHSSDAAPVTTSLLDRAGLDRDEVRRKSCAGWPAPTTASCFLSIGNPKASALTTAASSRRLTTPHRGFGLRAVKDDAVGYAHSSDVSLQALIRAADTVSAVRGGYSGTFAAAPGHTNVRLYGDDNPLDGQSFETKVKLLAEIDAYVRDKDPRVRQGVGVARRDLAGGGNRSP